MSKKRTASKPVELPHETTMTLPDERTLIAGDEFTVKGKGRFRFEYRFGRDGSVTAYGPINSHKARWRSFKPEAVGPIHRKKQSVRHLKLELVNDDQPAPPAHVRVVEQAKIVPSAVRNWLPPGKA